jgi:hypothetical protein
LSEEAIAAATSARNTSRRVVIRSLPSTAAPLARWRLRYHSPGQAYETSLGTYEMAASPT